MKVLREVTTKKIARIITERSMSTNLKGQFLFTYETLLSTSVIYAFLRWYYTVDNEFANAIFDRGL